MNAIGQYFPVTLGLRLRKFPENSENQKNTSKEPNLNAWFCIFFFSCDYDPTALRQQSAVHTISSGLKGYLITLGQTLTKLPEHFLMPTLSEPHHLLQRKQHFRNGPVSKIRFYSLPLSILALSWRDQNQITANLAST